MRGALRGMEHPDDMHAYRPVAVTRRCCTDIILDDKFLPKTISGGGLQITNGVWPSGVQHAVENSDANGRFRALPRQTACT